MRALEIQRITKKKLGTIMVEQGYFTTNALVGVLYKQSQIAKQHQGKRQSLAAIQRISPQEMSAAVAAAREQQQPLGTVLLERFHLSREEAGQALSSYYKCPFAEFSETVVIPPELTARDQYEVSPYPLLDSFARRRRVGRNSH
jgi:hypothetical protein